MNALQSDTEGSTGAPFVLVDHYCIIVEDRVVHNEGYSCEIAWGEIVDDSGSFVEYHVEANVLGHFPFSIYGEFVAVIDDEGGEHREMEQPLLSEYPVVAITTSNADMSDVDVDVRSIRISGFKVIGGLDASSLIADACQP